MKKVRTFDFPRETSLPEASRQIVAALEDEGLAVAGLHLQGFNPFYGIRFSGSADGTEPSYFRVVLPTRYIIEEVQG